MQLTETQGQRASDRRYYIDGRRVRRERFDDVKRNHRLDTFHTTRRNGRIRLHCHASAQLAERA